MWICINNKKITEINTKAVSDLLNIYSEEHLDKRVVFNNAFNTDKIEFRDLKSESEKILIPWQLFFLNPSNLRDELEHINKIRADKVSTKLVAKRKGMGLVTSKRIIDRLIRLQNFICTEVKSPINEYCGSLVGKTTSEAISHILSYFEINFDTFTDYKNKASALDYLIKKIEARNINLSQGVLTNKILPNWQVVENSVYKNTSGFVIKDESIPFLFLPSEINPEETDGRQIYTLIYLLVVTGLNQYDFILERDFKAKAISAKGQQQKIYRITSDLLLPPESTEEFRGKIITSQIRDNLSLKYKITPTAVVVILKIRKFITKEEYVALLPTPYIAPKIKERRHSPAIETSVRKFCGKYSFETINSLIKSNLITNTQAQYLLFGGINKKGFKTYRSRLKI